MPFLVPTKIHTERIEAVGDPPHIELTEFEWAGRVAPKRHLQG